MDNAVKLLRGFSDGFAQRTVERATVADDVENVVKWADEIYGPDEDLVYADAFEWLASVEPDTIQAVVPTLLTVWWNTGMTSWPNAMPDPEESGESHPGMMALHVPRYRVLRLSQRETKRTCEHFSTALPLHCSGVLVPGAHVFIATTPLLSHQVYCPLLEAGFEKRAEIVRIVKTLRGGDRPKGAHEEFPDVSVMPRSGWEPWGLFRKPMAGRVQDNLRQWGVGGLRRISEEQPFWDVITCPPASKSERQIAPHPSLKPQRLMRQLVRASLPLGHGTILDPFMGSGSTVAAARAEGLHAIGVESSRDYYLMARHAAPLLAGLKID